MKKTLLSVLLIISILSGCQNSTENSDFAFKEKCSQYTKQVKEEIEKVRQQYFDSDISISLEGVFFSKKLQTCVEIRRVYNKALYDIGENPNSKTYLDIMTSEGVNFNSLSPTATDEEKEAYLELVR